MIAIARPGTLTRCIAALFFRPARWRGNTAAIVHCLMGNRDRAVARLEESLAADFAQPAFQALLADILIRAGLWDGYARRGEFGLEIAAALNGLAKPPVRYDPALVGRLFDRLSPEYEARVLREEYAEHTRVAQAIAALAAPGAAFRVLDLGCGTGMLGAALRSAGSRASLIGIDISAAMLERARARSIYEELYCDDIVRFLGARALAPPVDAAGLASVIPFFGELEGLFDALGAYLRPGAWVVFSFDLAESVDVQFNQHGRFRHASAYVERVLSGAGFRVQSLDRFTARLEGGKPVPCVLAVARKIEGQPP